MAFNLKKVLRALLFSSNHPLAIKDIQVAFTRFHETAMSAGAAAVDANAPAPVATEEEETEGEMQTAEAAELYAEVPTLVTATQIREAMDELAAELRADDDSLLLIEGATGYRLVTHPRFARWIRVLRNEPPPVRLSRSAVETLAIVAYRQPVTRADIETIRGVSADAGINKLIERDLIYIVGRADTPGRPIQYGTTDQFLEFTGIKSVDELPASDVLSTRQIDEWLQNAANPAKPPADAEMGLPLEIGEGETPNLEPVSVEQSVPAGEVTETSANNQSA